MGIRISRRQVLPLAAAAALAARPSSARQDAPCIPATPVGTYQPGSDAWVFAGRGYTVSEPVTLRDGLVMLTAESDAAIIVQVHSLQDGWEVYDLEIAAWRPFRGTVADSVDAGDYIIAVECDGSWTIWIEQHAFDAH